MNKNYQIIVNKELSYDSAFLQQVAIDAQLTKTAHYHLIHQHQSFKAEVVSADFNSKTYLVRVNHNEYKVEIHTPLDNLIKEMGFEIGKTKQVNALHSPMPGLILKINVAVGDTVQEQEPLLILGAMKMENSLLSPREGVIKSIVVTTDEAVDKGQLLIEFE